MAAHTPEEALTMHTAHTVGIAPPNPVALADPPKPAVTEKSAEEVLEGRSVSPGVVDVVGGSIAARDAKSPKRKPKAEPKVLSALIKEVLTDEQRAVLPESLFSQGDAAPKKIQATLRNIFTAIGGLCPMSLYVPLVLQGARKRPKSEFTFEHIVRHLIDERRNGVKSYSLNTAQAVAGSVLRAFVMTEVITPKDHEGVYRLNAGSAVLWMIDEAVREGDSTKIR